MSDQPEGPNEGNEPVGRDPAPSSGRAEDTLEPQTARDGEDDPEAEDFPSVDALLGTFMSEASLWPVLIVALGSAGAFGAAMLVLAFVDRNPFAMGALLLVAGMTVDVGLRARREAGFRHLARFAALIWLAAFAFAGLAVWTGLAFD